MIKLASCNQLMYLHWKIIISDDIDDIDEDEISKITDSTYESNTSKSNP